MSTVASVACDVRTTLWASRSAPTIFIVRGRYQLRQARAERMVWRAPLDTRMRPLGVVPSQVLGDVGGVWRLRRADFLTIENSFPPDCPRPGVKPGVST